MNFILICMYMLILLCNNLFIQCEQASNGQPIKRAIIIGASSGMGRAVAKLLALDGYVVGLAARRLPLLHKLQQEIITPSYCRQMDASKPYEALDTFHDLINEMGGVDLVVITITGFRAVNFSDRNWDADKAILDIDVLGFYTLARETINFFEKQGHGHLIGFSSLDGMRGVAGCPTYSAAKSFASRYMEAERNRCAQKNIPIVITDILPGWINSEEDPDFQKKHPKAYWVDTLDDAAKEVFQAIKNKQTIAYVPKRWEEVAAMIKVMPDGLYNALGGL